jgi:nucleoid-associated protein YgaU
MATDTRFACPVCSEPYDAPVAACFRCETSLDSWWRFEEAAARRPSPEPSRAPRWAPLLAAAVLGAAVSAAVLWTMVVTPSASTTPSAFPAAPVPAISVAPYASPPAASPAPPVILYRVQPGDSLWRIAAALTGDGRNWKTLWPTIDPARPLAVGAVLEAPPAAR